MKDLYVSKDDHTYYYKGEKKDCVSDILEILDVIQLKGIPIRNLEKAAERGTRVHEQTEDFEFGLVDLTDEDWLAEYEDIETYVYAYANFLKDHPEKPIASEESLYSEKYDFAGTIDLVKYYEGELTILDKKTSKTLGILRTTLQLNGYRLLWNALHPDMQVNKLKILQLSDNGTYEIYNIEVNEELFFKYLAIFKEIKGDKKL